MILVLGTVFVVRSISHTNVPGPSHLPTPSRPIVHPAPPLLGTASPSWSDLNLLSNQSPPGRVSGYSMAYDPADGYLVLFGGCTSGDYWYSTCQPTNQTWIFSNSTWTLLNLSVAPSPRFYTSLTWDAADGYLLLFGGNGSASAGFLNDSWSFLNGTWTQLHPSVAPPARAAASLTYDAHDGYVLLYGGEGNRTLVNAATETYSGWDYGDTWSFVGGNWTQRAIAGPPARDSAGLTYDAARGQVVLFGGFNWSSYNQGDTWTYSNGSWSALPTAGNASAWGPNARNNGALAYDPAILGDVLFGGHDGFYFMNDTDELTNGSWSAPALSTAPSPRWGASLAWDPQVGCLVLFGGYSDPPQNTGTRGFFSDTWVFGSHCAVTINSGPAGGAVNATWTQLSPSSSPPGLTSGYSMSYDPTDGYLLLFGGCDSGNYWYSTCHPTNATWVFSGGNWTRLNLSVAPPARYYSSLTWDAKDGYLLLFGGNGSSGFLNDTWSFVHGAWSQLHPSNAPEPRAAASLTYDAHDGYVVLYGGEAQRTLVSAATETYSGWDFADTWSFVAGNWTNFSIASPPARDSASMTYDATTGEVVLFGGFNWTSYNQADTWFFQGGVWSAASGVGTPAGRNNGALAYDPALASDILFGGHQGSWFMNDTVALANGTWSQLTPGTAPSMRWGASLAWDPQVGCLVLFGGYDGSPGNTGSGPYFSDTWTFGVGCKVP